PPVVDVAGEGALAGVEVDGSDRVSALQECHGEMHGGGRLAGTALFIAQHEHMRAGPSGAEADGCGLRCDAAGTVRRYCREQKPRPAGSRPPFRMPLLRLVRESRARRATPARVRLPQLSPNVPRQNKTSQSRSSCSGIAPPNDGRTATSLPLPVIAALRG